MVDAGFTEVRVSRPDLESFACEAGLLEDQTVLVRDVSGPQPVTARRP